MRVLGRLLPGVRLACAAVLAVATGAALAQTDVTTSRINGTVRDATGATLPGVSVEGKNLETGLTANAVTDANGGYRLLNLPTGRYSVTAKLSGFKTETRPDVKLILGSAPTVDFRLDVTGVAESVTVTSEVPVVEVANTAASTTIQTEQVKALPLNGRNFTDLVLLTPQTRRESERGTLAISGQRGLMTNVTVDGSDFNNPFFGGTVGAAEGRAPLAMSEESIKEISVITNGASVEFGRNGGGVVNVITKSGTNTFHGSAFYYWQPQDLIAKFANGTAPADQSKKQYGASLGGPILKDKVFFFGSYERLKQDITVPLNSSVDDPAVEAKYPALATPSSFAQQITNPIAFGRLDIQALETQRITVRGNYTTYDGVNGTNNSQTRAASNNGQEGLFSRAWVAQWSGQFGSSLLNDLTGNYINEDTPRTQMPSGENLPEFRLPSSVTYGGVSFLPITSKVERKQVTDTITYLVKNHVAKVGFDYNDTSIDQVFKGNWRGVFQFNSKSDFLAGKWTQYFQFGGLRGLTADQAGRAAFGQKELAFFVQDQWFVNPRLTITAGVRYERLDNPDDPVLNPNHVLNDGSCLKTTSNAVNGCFALDATIPDANNQWSPRLGISWSPDSKTVVRIAGGRYWSRTPAILFAQLFTSNGIQGTQYTINAPRDAAGNPLQPTDPLSPGWGANFNPVGVERIDFTKVPGVAAKPGVFAIDPNFQNPRTDRLTAGIEREVMENTSAGLDFTWANTNQLQRLTDINRVYAKNADGTIATNPTNGQPIYSSTTPNPYYGRITTSLSDAQSRYLAISFKAQRRFADNFSLFAQVTWSQDMDNDSNERNFAGVQPEDFNNLNGTYGYSVRDQKWKAGLNGVWATPFWGLGLAGSVVFNTGAPFNPTTGNDANNDGFFNDRPTIDGVHLARNSYRQPSFYTTSLRLSKTVNIGPVALQVFGECFNCTNTGNKFVTNTTYYSNATTKTVSTTFGTPTGVGTPRTFQFAARVDF